MKQFLRFFSVCLSVVLLLHSSMPGFAAASEAAEPTTSETAPTVSEQQLEESTESHVIVSPSSFEEYAFFAEDAAQAQNIADRMGAYLVSYQYGIGTLRFTDAPALRSQVAQDGITLYPEYDYFVEQTEESPVLEDCSLDQWHLPILHASEALEAASGQGVLVAVIDTGIDESHADLAGGIAAAETTIPSDYYGDLCMFPGEYQGSHDNLGHGTHVAGIIGARKNLFGCTGIAPESSILSIKALERSGTQGKGKSSWVAAAVNLAVERGADIINLSLGGSLVKDQLLMVSVENALAAGIAVVCAAGNTSSPVLMYPAAYEGTIAVSAVKPQGDSVTFASSYSNSGDWIDVAAPGTNILSTVPGGYEKKTGTSMACPMVSGALALLFSADNLLTADQAVDILYQTAVDLGEPGKDTWYGRGLLDLQAMTALHQQLLSPDMPAAVIPSGNTLYQNTPVDIFTETLHGTVLYTVDGSEPVESSAVWPEDPMIFPEDVSEVTINARTLSGDGRMGETVSFSYRFVPEITDIAEDSGTVIDVIPGYASVLDPVLQLPCRRYRITLPPEYQLEIVPSAQIAGVRLCLFDAEGDDASQLAVSMSGETLMWKNDYETEKTVILSLISEEPSETLQDIPYSFQFSKQEIPAETEPVETEPAETEPAETQPAETEPAETEPAETQPRETVPKATDPVQKQEPENSDSSSEETWPDSVLETELTEETIPATIFQDFEEDWLYTMEEPTATATTAPSFMMEETTAEGEEDTVETFDYRFLLAGGIIVLFGLGLLLLGLITGRKIWLLIRDGETATATVLQIIRCADDLASQDLRATKHYTFRYQMSYRTKNGQLITAFWNEYPRIQFTRQHPEGSRLTIKYLPESPEEFMVTKHSRTMLSSAACIVIGAGLIVLGIWVAYLISTLV